MECDERQQRRDMRMSWVGSQIHLTGSNATTRSKRETNLQKPLRPLYDTDDLAVEIIETSLLSVLLVNKLVYQYSIDNTIRLNEARANPLTRHTWTT